MSMLQPPEEEQKVTGTSPIVAHCNSCGNDYYLMASPNQTPEQLIGDTICPCGNSDIVAKGTVDGKAEVSGQENVPTN